MSISFVPERGVGACARRVRAYRISRSPDVPLARIVPDTIAFGLKRGVGMDTMSAFFVRLRLQHSLGCSPTALRGVMHVLEEAV